MKFTKTTRGLVTILRSPASFPNKPYRGLELANYGHVTVPAYCARSKRTPKEKDMPQERAQSRFCFIGHHPLFIGYHEVEKLASKFRSEGKLVQVRTLCRGPL